MLVKIEKLHIMRCECSYTILTKQINNIISFYKKKDLMQAITFKKKKKIIIPTKSYLTNLEGILTKTKKIKKKRNSLPKRRN